MSPVQMPPTSSSPSGARAMNMFSMAASGGFQARHESAAKYSSRWAKPIPITRIDTASRAGRHSGLDRPIGTGDRTGPPPDPQSGLDDRYAGQKSCPERNRDD